MSKKKVQIYDDMKKFFDEWIYFCGKTNFTESSLDHRAREFMLEMPSRVKELVDDALSNTQNKINLSKSIFLRNFESFKDYLSEEKIFLNSSVRPFIDNLPEELEKVIEEAIK